VRETPGKAMPDIVFEYFTQKFGLKSVAVTRLNHLVTAVVEHQGASEWARIFARLSGLSAGDYQQEGVTLFCAAYDALDLYADGPNLNSRSWFDLGFGTRVVLGDCLFVTNRLFTSGGATRSLSTQKLKEACDRMVKFQNKCVTVNDIMPPKANRAGYLRYQKEKGKKKKEKRKGKKKNLVCPHAVPRDFLLGIKKGKEKREKKRGEKKKTLVCPYAVPGDFSLGIKK
jgi:hypothetical protein